jgi:hypothetical protein
MRSSTQINILSWKECESVDWYGKQDCRAAETYFLKDLNRAKNPGPESRDARLSSNFLLRRWSGG